MSISTGHTWWPSGPLSCRHSDSWFPGKGDGTQKEKAPAHAKKPAWALLSSSWVWEPLCVLEVCLPAHPLLVSPFCHLLYQFLLNSLQSGDSELLLSAWPITLSLLLWHIINMFRRTSSFPDAPAAPSVYPGPTWPWPSWAQWPPHPGLGSWHSPYLHHSCDI